MFKEDSQILTCRAKLTNGTFTNYLDTGGISWQTGFEISLDESLSRVIETSEDYFTVARKSPRACPVRVEARHTGRMVLHFREDWVESEAHFRSHWESEFPSLVPFCELESTGCVLKIKQDKEPNNFEEVADLCQKMLDVNLIPESKPDLVCCSMYRSTANVAKRGVLFCSLFILGSIVRYQPELIYQITSGNSNGVGSWEDSLSGRSDSTHILCSIGLWTEHISLNDFVVCWVGTLSILTIFPELAGQTFQHG